MTILALDVGTHCGWAAFYDTDIIYGCKDFKLKRGDSPGLRFIQFTNWFVSQLNQFRPDLVIYEQAHFRGGYATELLVGFTTRIMEFCAARGIEYAAIHSGTLKKWAVGSGRADKRMMMDGASVRIGRKITNEHIADALWLMFYANANFSEPKADKKEDPE